MRAPLAQPVAQKINYATAPAPADGTGWRSNNGTLYTFTYDATGGRRAGAGAIKCVRNTATLNNSLCSSYMVGITVWNVPGRVPCAAGEVWTVSVWSKASVAGKHLHQLNLFDAANVAVSTVTSPTVNAVANEWVRTVNTFLVPANATNMGIGNLSVSTLSGAAAVGGETSWLADCLYEKVGTLSTYFDGDTPGCYWEGPPHASRSITPGIFATEQTNLAMNPIADTVNTTFYWTESRSTLAIGTGYLRATITDALAVNMAQRLGTPQVGVNRVSVSPGDTVRVSGQVRSSASLPMMETLQWYDAAGVTITQPGSVSVTTNPTTWTNLPDYSAVAPANAAFVSANIGISGTGARAIGNTFDVRHVLISKSSALAGYFDGTMPGCYWAGTPHQSASAKAGVPYQRWTGAKLETLSLAGITDAAGAIVPATFTEVEVT